MEIMAIAQLIPVVYAAVGIIKRFIPDKQRTIANPILAVVTGLVGAYVTGGSQEVITTLITGGLAGAAAIGAYKIPKEIGVKLGVE